MTDIALEAHAYVISVYPMARCIPESMEGGWRPGMVRNYVIVPNPQTREYVGKGISVSDAWVNAERILKGEIEPENATASASDAKPDLVHSPAAILRNDPILPANDKKKKRVVKQWNSREYFEDWACERWHTTKNTLFMKRDPINENEYFTARVQAAWEGWQGRDKVVKPRKVK